MIAHKPGAALALRVSAAALALDGSMGGEVPTRDPECEHVGEEEVA